MRIVVSVNHLREEDRRRISINVPATAEVVFADRLPADADRQQAVATADVVFGNVEPAWLRAAPNVRWVQLDSAGVDAYLTVNHGRAAHPIAITHLREFYDRAVAEAGLAGILAWYRRLPVFCAAQRDAHWVKPQVEPTIGQLHGARVVVLGAGAVARRIERLLHAFDCDVCLYARRSAAAQLHTLAELDAALPTTEIVINTLPHTPDTVFLLDRERLARLGPSAVIVNVGRGSVMDEAALVSAIDANRLGGAVLDVTSVEPLPADSPLWKNPRIILTQHTAGRFPGEISAKIDRFLANYGRFMRGEAFPDLMDEERGY